MAAQYDAINNRQDDKSSFYKTHLNKALCSHKPTLSHSDVERKNLVVNGVAREDAEETTLSMPRTNSSFLHPSQTPG